MATVRPRNVCGIRAPCGWCGGAPPSSCRLAVDFRLARKRLLAQLVEWLETPAAFAELTSVPSHPAVAALTLPLFVALEGRAREAALEAFNAWFEAGA